MLRLYSYYRSSAAYRVRIALQLKGLDWNYVPVNLLKGEQHSGGYRAVNPQALVPAIEVDGHALTQSLAIIEWLEERYPNPPLLPPEPLLRARVRALAYQVAMDIHPLNNLRVVNYLKEQMNLDESQKLQWYRHWIAEGFQAVEQSLRRAGCDGCFCLGETATLADICLVPQVYNALRFDCDLSSYPLIHSVWEHCSSLAPFQRAAPESQPDHPEP